MVSQSTQRFLHAARPPTPPLPLTHSSHAAPMVCAAMDIFRGEPMPRRWDPTWWDRHLYNNTVADMVTVLDDIYANAASFASLQVVGYCYGGGVAAGLTAVERPVLSAVSAHPTWEDLQGNSELGELETLVDNTSSLFFIMVSQHTHSTTAARSQSLPAPLLTATCRLGVLLSW